MARNNFRKNAILINQQHIFKRLRSDNPHEREIAAHKLYESFVANGGHPDDWEIRKKGMNTDAANDARIKDLKAKADLANTLLDLEKERSQAAREEAKRNWVERQQIEVELAKVREQLKKNAPRPNRLPIQSSGLTF